MQNQLSSKSGQDSIFRALKSITILSILISGCAMLEKNEYKAPYDKPIAKLVITFEVENYLAAFNSADFTVHDSVMCGSNENGRELAYLGFLSGSQTEKVIEANRDLVFTVWYKGEPLDKKTLPTTKCGMTNIFSPQTGKTYRANFSATHESCSLVITEIVSMTPPKEVGVKTEKLLQPCFIPS